MSENFMVRALSANSDLSAVMLKGQGGGKKITTMEDVARKMAAAASNENELVEVEAEEPAETASAKSTKPGTVAQPRVIQQADESTILQQNIIGVMFGGGIGSVGSLDGFEATDSVFYKDANGNPTSQVTEYEDANGNSGKSIIEYDTNGRITKISHFTEEDGVKDGTIYEIEYQSDGSVKIKQRMENEDGWIFAVSCPTWTLDTEGNLMQQSMIPGGNAVNWSEVFGLKEHFDELKDPNYGKSK